MRYGLMCALAASIVGAGCGHDDDDSPTVVTFTPPASASGGSDSTAAGPGDDARPGDDDGADDATADDTGPCDVGTEGCPCFGGGACEAGLDCVEGVCVSQATCQNGHIERGEGCDDGNARAGDGCEPDCTVTPGASAITAGGSHTCALLFDGAVRCWGRGANGRLGYADVASIGDDETPASVGDIEIGGRALAITAGNAHTCALLEGGAVRCWGTGADGRLGHGATVDIGDDETPATAGDVPLGSAALAVTAGGSHTCAVLDAGSVRCWGASGSGKLGVPGTGDIGDDEPASAAAVVQLGGEATAIALGINHSCAVRADGAALCWGSGGFGRLGYASTADVGDDEAPSTFGPIDLGGAPVASAAPGASHTCMRTATGVVRCFGFADFGQLGYGDTAEIGDDEAPIGAVPLGITAVEIRAGNDHGCALGDAGEVVCWGRNGSGQLGLASTDDIGDDELPSSVGPVDLGGPAIAIAVGQAHSCALLQDGAVRCWGAAADGQLGTGDTQVVGDDETPASIPPVVLQE